MNKYNLLLVEDDESLGYVLSEYLKMNDFNISWVKSGKSALNLLAKQAYDLCILDIMMPEMDGFELARKINERKLNIPFLFLTARSLKIDVLKGFALGAADYIRKPIDEEELVIRLKKLLQLITNKKEDKQEEKEYISIGKYKLYLNSYILNYNKTDKHLTVREFELLHLLIKNKNVICQHQEILSRIWGNENAINKKSLNVFITRLRKYLSNDSSIKIENIHNKGFILSIKKD
ncbi:MAG: response regulator transcription factor [Lutibacter sp.]